MSERYKNKYRIASVRLQHWDYGWNAAYFVTICTQHRVCFFGNVVDGKMVLNDIGKIANDCWLQIPEHFPFVKLGNHVVMPNHVHGIVVIDNPDGGRNDGLNVPNDGRDDGRNDGRNVETRLIASLPPSQSPPPSPPSQSNSLPGGVTGNKNPMLHDNLPKIIRWYKGRTTFESRKLIPRFTWQSRYHDHIIRNEASFYRISEYIKNNPANWKEDTFHG